jgi:hypothetical protein
VCAAGNNGVNVTAVTPASMNDVIAVGAYDVDLKPADYGIWPASIIDNTRQKTNNGIYEVFAPGTTLVVADLAGEYGLGAGTSLASAIHATVVAHTLGNYYSIQAGLESEINYNTSRELAKFVSAYNFGLLDTSDPWFTNIVNSTSILKSQAPTMTDIVGQYGGYNVYNVTTGVPFKIKIFRTMALNSYSILSGSLPAGVTMTDGWIHGTATLSGSLAETYNFTVLFDLDGDPTRNVADFILTVSPV